MAPAMQSTPRRSAPRVRSRGPGERKASVTRTQMAARARAVARGPLLQTVSIMSAKTGARPVSGGRVPSARRACRSDAAHCTRYRPSQMSEPFWFSTYRMRPRVPSRSAKRRATSSGRSASVNGRTALGRQVLVDVLQDLPVRVAPCIQEQPADVVHQRDLLRLVLRQQVVDRAHVPVGRALVVASGLQGGLQRCDVAALRHQHHDGVVGVGAAEHLVDPSADLAGAAAGEALGAQMAEVVLDGVGAQRHTHQHGTDEAHRGRGGHQAARAEVDQAQGHPAVEPRPWRLAAREPAGARARRSRRGRAAGSWSRSSTAPCPGRR